MKNLLVLWDTQNPIVPAALVVQALKAVPGVAVNTLTFRDLGHQTLPNRAFKLSIPPTEPQPDGILWIEGGPFPGNLEDFTCPKACWLVNTALEPSLLEDVGSRFDRIFSASLSDTWDERAFWLPLVGESGERTKLPEGVSILVADPEPPQQVELEHRLQSEHRELGRSRVPVILALGNGRQPHPLLFDCLRSGAAVVVDPDTDLRGLAHVGEHLDVFPSRGELPKYLESLLKDPERLARLSTRGPAIAEHLHQPAQRAARICEGLWPQVRILSGEQHQPRVSILVTCFRYLRRFRVCLESLARQDMPPGSLEIVVADPSSPDGLKDSLAQFAQCYPAIRVVHCPIDPRYHRNRGLGINRAFEASAAPVVIGIDGDIVFPPALIRFLEEKVLETPDRVFGVRRSFLAREETELILRGELDPFMDFERLSRSEGDGEEKSYVGVLGYCQAVHRMAFARAGYPEEFDVVNQSDIVFVERLSREANVKAQFLQDQSVLHLWHPRNWMGTNESL